MRKDTGQVFRLEDYKTSDYLIPRIKMNFILEPEHTLVIAELEIERRSETNIDSPLVLDGDELTFVSLEINGAPADESAYQANSHGLTVLKTPSEQTFKLTITTRINPSQNGALMGLYLSNNVYCTQCEPEGFRRITYFLDRPDILSVYTVRIEAAAWQAPILLSNGNLIESGNLENDRHFAVWNDPFPKPSYLFALVAGDLEVLKDDFTTASGRNVKLGIYVEHGKAERAAYAMDALKRSMKWDEEVFGLEYDLDIFNIVAVSDFNMGAMENKGLNIFNDKYVLADEGTATDADFDRIEAIIAHEYFHNWTGNRITCRDWFQLCLKEGLTVFRDHEFSADMRSRAVKRIAEVRALRALQFPEDQGPLAHPVRPRQYREINNFYTATVYEKGSEVVRMIRTILGSDAFRKGLKLYLTRHDGDAATIEDFITSFEDSSGKDLSQFSLWYHQAGTPEVVIEENYDAENSQYVLTVSQSLAPTPGENMKQPMYIPLEYDLMGSGGESLHPSSIEGVDTQNGVLHIQENSHTIRFNGIGQRPVLSVNRGFSAPVSLSFKQGKEDLLFLARKDSDLFSRWEALNKLFIGEMVAGVEAVRQQLPLQFNADLAEIAGEISSDDKLEHAFRALALTLPSEADIARTIGNNIDPDAIFVVRQALIEKIGIHNQKIFAALHGKLQDSTPFSPDAANAGRRALKGVLLDYLTVATGTPELAAKEFEAAINMTDKAAALTVLAHRLAETDEAKSALRAFETQYGDDPLIMDKWYQIQATIPGGKAVERVKDLMKHKAFALSNPNRVRSLIGTFSLSNQTGFHGADGAGYEFFANTILEIEKRNPQLSARLATAFRSWRSLEPTRQAAAHSALMMIANAENLSSDLRDIVERTLA